MGGCAVVLINVAFLLFSVNFSHSGNRITEQLQEESKTWVGELMVVFGFLFVAGDFISAKAQG